MTWIDWYEFWDDDTSPYDPTGGKISSLLSDDGPACICPPPPPLPDPVNPVPQGEIINNGVTLIANQPIPSPTGCEEHHHHHHHHGQAQPAPTPTPAWPASPPPNWYSFSWASAPDSLFCHPLVVGVQAGGVPLEPAVTAAAMLVQPVGQRALIIQFLGRTLIDPADKILSPQDGQYYQGLWLTAGIANTRSMWTTWLQQFAAAGGIIERLAIDNEDYYSIFDFTYKGGPLPADQLIAIVADPRFTAAIAAGKAPDFTVQGYLMGSAIYFDPAAQSLFNSYAYAIFAAALQAAIIEPLLSVFPAAKASQYNNQSQAGAVPDVNGFFQAFDYVRVGTDQSPFFYSAGINASTPFAALLYSINWFSQSVGIGDPITPWLGAPAADTTNVLADTPYYTEIVYHTSMIGAQVLFFYDPPAVPQDITTFSNARQTLYNQAQGGAFSETVLYQPTTNVLFVASGAKFSNGLTVYRVTFAPGVAAASFLGLSLSPDPGDVGTWLVLPAPSPQPSSLLP